MNSLKMKISVIFGVLQMSIGILLKGLNSLYYKQYIDFCFEFLPQIIVLLALFGYMDALIIQKWLTDFSGREGYAPSVIATMIDMFLNGAKPSIATDEPLFNDW
jgi:V-type H+-transporting ATPase subunit a